MIRKLQAALAWLKETQQRERELRQQLQQWEQQVKALSRAEAEAAARASLADPQIFQCVRDPVDAHDPDERFEPLSPLLRAFFCEYAEVAALARSTELARALIAPSPVLPGFIQIGIDTENRQIAVTRGDDLIYLVASDVPAATAAEEEYETIYHYLAFVALFSGAEL